jgi:hypothetical protein
MIPSRSSFFDSAVNSCDGKIEALRQLFIGSLTITFVEVVLSIASRFASKRFLQFEIKIY